MLRILLKIVALLGALLLLLLGALAVVLPRLIQSEEFTTTLRTHASEALGSPVEWASMDVGLLPPRLVLERPVLLGARAGAEEAHLQAESVDLRISLWPLLARRVEVASLVLHAAELVVTRAPEGLILPFGGGEPDAPGADDAAAGGTGAGAPPAPPTEIEEGFELALRRIVIDAGRIVVRDHVLPDPVAWRFEELELVARGRSPADPIEIEARARLARAEREIGRVEVKGEVTLGGVYDLDVGLAEVVLIELAPYMPSDMALEGRLSGRVSVEGATSALAEVDVDVTVDDLRWRGLGLDLAGDFELKARQALDDPIDFVASLDLAEDGKARVEGALSLEGALEAHADLDALDLAPYASLAGAGRSIAGRARGRVELASTAEQGLTRLKTDLEIASARYADGTLDVAGELELGLALEGLGETDPIRFDIGLVLATGGRVETAGTATRAGSIDGKARFEDVDLVVFAPLLQTGTQVEGALTGRLDLRLAADRTIQRLDTDLRIQSARLVSAPVDVSGAFSLVMGLEGKGPAKIEAGLRLVDGGLLDVKGTTTLDGVLDLNADIESLDLGIAKPFLPSPEMQIGGIATGKARLVGQLSSPEFVGLDVGVESGLVRVPDYAVDGPFLLDLKVKEPLSGRPRGTLELDLTAASVEYGEQFKKRAGMRAEMVTKFAPDEKGEIVFESRIKLRDINEILLQGFVGESVSVAATTPLFNLDGWSEVIPALAPYALEGPVVFEGLGVELIDGAPSRFGGRLQLRGVGVSVPEAGRVRVRGQVLGEGTTIRTRGLKMLAKGLELSIQGQIDDPLDQARYELAVNSVGEAEVNDLLSSLTSAKDTLFGPLDLKGEIKGSARSQADFYQSLEGQLGFTIGKNGGGRLRGVSILRTVLDQLPLLGGAARLTQPFRGGRSVEDYFSEKFEVIEGNFDIGGGQVYARPLRLAYDGYEARLEGPMRLEDLTVDMRGEILLKGDLVSAIGGLAGAKMEERNPIRIPLARVTNTLSEPKVEMTAETLAAVPKLLFQATGIDTLTIGVGKAIGRVLSGEDP